MFPSFFLKSFRILLFPFALLYWLAIAVRNWLYDRKFFRSAEFALPVICVGNLSVGGTGKSPMVEYLVRLLMNEFKVATLSRGYKRKTKGYALANTNTTALEIGDEPMQFHLKFPNVPVAVGEQRVEAIPQLLHDRPDTEAIILDDAFQHRSIKAGLNILLTEYSNLYTHDFYLPTGDLRDLKISARRADIIVVTKCRVDLTEQERDQVLKDLSPSKQQLVFFSTIEYGELYHIGDRTPRVLEQDEEVLLVTGIANPKPLKTLLEDYTHSYSLAQYADHHIFTIDDLKEIRNRFNALDGERKLIITTEKDAVRLAKFSQEMAGLPLFVLPIRHKFLFAEGSKFDQAVSDFIRNFKGVATAMDET
jgi:tetraacyldisaccharide 4'-kinase